MKKRSLTALAALCLLLTVSCEEEIEIFVDGDEPVLLMNAQLSTEDDVHTVMLNLSRIAGVTPCSAATVTVTVNGTERITAEEEPQEELYTCSYYIFRAGFKPGDTVRIDAVRGDLHAFAETTFPAAAGITSLEVTRDGETDPSGILFRFTAGIRDIPGEDSFYRIGLAADMEVHSIYEGAPERVWRDYRESRYMLDASSDPIISEGRVSSSDRDLFAELLAGNAYAAFTDRQFADGECTLRFSSWREFFKPESFDITAPVEHCYSTAVLKLYTLSFAEYRYLRALDNFEAYGYEMSFFAEPTALPSNVTGGIGFVSASTCVSRSLLVDDYIRSNMYTGDEREYHGDIPGY